MESSRQGHPFDRQDLNFDSEFRFTTRNGKVSLVGGTPLPLNFFSKSSHVESVSAVVGANGAGKTMVARVLSSLFRGTGEFRTWCIIAICEGSSICATTLPIDAVNGFQCQIVNEIPKNWNLVYISNHFSEKMQIEPDQRRVLDYSTSGLVLGLSSLKLGWGDFSGTFRYGGIGLYNSEQYVWILRFLATLIRKRLIKNLQENTGVKFPKSIKFSVNQELLDTNYRLFCETVQQVDRESDVYMRTVDLFLRGDRPMNLFVGSFINIVAEYLRTRGMDSDYVRDDDLTKMLLFMAEYLFCVLDEGEYMTGNLPEWNVYGLKEKVIEESDTTRKGAIRRVLSYMCRLIEENVEIAHCRMYQFLVCLDKFCQKYGDETSESLIIDVGDEKAISELAELIDIMSALGTSERPIVFEISPGMSSGELAYLILWSRLFDAVSTNRIKGCQTLFFFDEAETTLHPDWQRRLVANILWLFESVAPDVSAHLIFASHSPMLLSDIPKNNVLFLFDARDGQKSARQREELERLKNSFGANIFDLYRYSYFLEQGTVGLFAQRKIDGLVEKVFARVRLKDSKKAEEMTEEDKKIIELIGDDKVRIYLENWAKALGSLC